jgi:hypothetical protein
MIPARDEARRALTGAWWLFLRRPDGMRFFDLTVEGFWRSFGAIWLVLPAYAVIALADRHLRLADPNVAAGFSDAAYAAATVIELAIDWVALPVLLGILARPLGIADRYVPFIVARNWATVIALLPYAVAALLVGFGPDIAQLGSILSLAALFLVLRYAYVVARIALGAGIAFAVGLVAVDFLLSLTIQLVVERAFGV